jgi:hypothetical protein
VDKITKKLYDSEQECIRKGMALCSQLMAATNEVFATDGLDSASIAKLRLIVGQLDDNNAWHNRLVDALEGSDEYKNGVLHNLRGRQK